MAARRKKVEPPAILEPPPPLVPSVHVSSADVRKKREARTIRTPAGPAKPPRARPAPPPPLDASPEMVEQGISLTDEPATDPEIAQQEAAIVEQEAARRAGKDPRRATIHVDDQIRFDRYVPPWVAQGMRVIVFVRRLSPTEEDLGDINIRQRGIESYGDLVAVVRADFWDGHESVFQWTAKINGQIITRGHIRTSESAQRQAEWAAAEGAEIDEAELEPEREPEAPRAAFAPRPRFCPSCGSPNPATSRFCGGCGATQGAAPLAAPPPAAAPPVAPSSPWASGQMAQPLTVEGRPAILYQGRLIYTDAPPPPPAPPPAQRVTLPDGSTGLLIDGRVIPETPAQREITAATPGATRATLPDGSSCLVFDGQIFPAVPAPAAAPVAAPAAPLSTMAQATEAIRQAKADRDALDATLREVGAAPAAASAEAATKAPPPDGFIDLEGLVLPKKFVQENPAITGIMANLPAAGEVATVVLAQIKEMMASQRDAADAERKKTAKHLAEIERVNNEEERAQKLRENRLKQQARELALEQERAAAAALAAASLGSAPPAPRRVAAPELPEKPLDPPAEGSGGPGPAEPVGSASAAPLAAGPAPHEPAPLDPRARPPRRSSGAALE